MRQRIVQPKLEAQHDLFFSDILRYIQDDPSGQRYEVRMIEIRDVLEMQSTWAPRFAARAANCLRFLGYTVTVGEDAKHYRYRVWRKLGPSILDTHKPGTEPPAS